MSNIGQSLSVIESWLDKKGFVLCKSNKRTIQDEVDFERKVVFLSLRSSPVNQLYSILHECGHIIVRGRKTYKEDFRDYISAAEGEGKITITSTVQEVEEEILAWREGAELAKKLSISMDREKYFKYGYKWVMGYIVLAAVGNEHLLPIAKDTTEETIIEDKKNIDIRKLLDNAHDSRYCKVIADPETSTV